MRGIVAFNAQERNNLRSTTSGHYTSYVYRPNDRWELYDDCKYTIIQVNQNNNVNADLIVFTI